MVGSDIGERTLMTRKQLAQIQSTHGPENDFVAKIGEFYLSRAEKNGYPGAAMYDPLAVGTVVDPTLVTLKEMHVDVETKGEFTRGETVANRMGANEKNVLHGDHYVIEGYDYLKTECKSVCSFRCGSILAAIYQPDKGKSFRFGQTLPRLLRSNNRGAVLAVRPNHQKNCQRIEDEHQGQI